MSPRSGLNFSTVFQKAVEIVEHNGINGLTMGILAKELNIKTPSLYNHVSGILEIQQKIAFYSLEKMHIAMRQASNKSNEVDDKIIFVGKAYLNYARQNPGLYEATFLPNVQDNKEVQKVSEQIVQICVELLHPFHLESSDTIHAVRGFRSFLHGFATIEKSGGFAIQLGHEESIEAILQIFMEGLKERAK
ncbi:WHG domain-containing protein [Bacillaceae bacterium S4-13-58]